MRPPSVRVGDVRVCRFGHEATLQLLRRWLRTSRPRRVATANVDFLRLARSSPQLRRALEGSDLVTADGMPLVWLSWLARRPIRERVAGVDLVDGLLHAAADGGHPVFLLGGAEGAAQDVARHYRVACPDLKVVGVVAPRVDMTDDTACRRLAATVRDSGAHLVLVALGCPKQELFLAKYGRALGCRVAVGVGGSFEMISGRLRRAPPWMRRTGLEWGYRLLQEPRRLAGRYARDMLFLGRTVLRTAGRRTGP